MKTLIIAPSWVGDMMMSQSLYRALKQRNPLAEIDVLAQEWSLPLLHCMPEVSRAITMPLGHGALALSERRKLGLALRKEQYQHAIVLPNSFKSTLIPFFAKIPKRTGWRGEMRYGLLNDLRVLNKSAFPRMVERYVALAYDKNSCHSATELPQPLLLPKLHVAEHDIAKTQNQFQLESSRSYIGLCPGAEFGPAKRWPHYHYANLAEKLISAGYRVMLFGSAKEEVIAEAILQCLPGNERYHCINMVGKTSLTQAVHLIAGSVAMISNDSGLMHITAALDRPLVALYGPTSSDFTPPLSEKASTIKLNKGYQAIRMGDSPEGYHQSLIDITPEQVLEQLILLLNTSR